MGGEAVNTIVTSREQILKASRGLIREKGWSAINIRSVAGACGVSVGSIYNYFSSKEELVEAAVESVWKDIFHPPQDPAVLTSIEACVVWLWERMAYGSREYPGFFTLHAVSFLGMEKSGGRQRMEQTWRHILGSLQRVLERDPRIRPGAFDPEFTAEKFADILFSLILSALLRGDCDPAPVLEIIRRTLY